MVCLHGKEIVIIASQMVLLPSPQYRMFQQLFSFLFNTINVSGAQLKEAGYKKSYNFPFR